jgi:hypothetical protein
LVISGQRSSISSVGCIIRKGRCRFKVSNRGHPRLQNPAGYFKRMSTHERGEYAYYEAVHVFLEGMNL